MVTKVKPSPFANGKSLLQEEPSEDMVLEGFKALHDELKDRLHKEIKSLETNVTLRVGEALESKQQGVVDQRFEGVETRLVDSIKDQVVASLTTHLTEYLEAHLDEGFGVLKKSFTRMLEEGIASCMKEVKDGLQELRDLHEMSLIQIRDLLAAIPVPQVHVTVGGTNHVVES